MDETLRFVCLRKHAYYSKNRARDALAHWRKRHRNDEHYIPTHFTASEGRMHVYECPYAGYDQTWPRPTRHWHLGHVLPETDTE